MQFGENVDFATALLLQCLCQPELIGKRRILPEGDEKIDIAVWTLLAPGHAAEELGRGNIMLAQDRQEPVRDDIWPNPGPICRWCSSRSFHNEVKYTPGIPRSVTGRALSHAPTMPGALH